jgi:hypothetical protein
MDPSEIPGIDIRKQGVFCPNEPHPGLPRYLNRTRLQLHDSIYLNTYLQCSMFAALEEAMGTSSTQVVRMHDEITVCRLHSQCTILTRSETGRPPTRCARHLTEGWRPGLRKSASGLLDGRSAWFGTDTRAPIAPTPMRVQHFGEKSTLARS